MTEPLDPEPLAPVGEALAPEADSRPSEPPGPEPLPPGFELPTAREVVGRGLQLAYDSTRDLRRASVYVGLLVAAVGTPFAALLLVDLPHFADLNLEDPTQLQAEGGLLLRLFVPLYIVGSLAVLGWVAATIDGLLMAVALLAGRAIGQPLRLREALTRARQVFWRYGAAAFVIGILSAIVSSAILLATGGFTRGGSLGSSLLASFISTLVAAPFGYVATGIVIGDVGAGEALGRSVTLVRARKRLAVVVAAFAFAAGALQTFGLGVAADLVGNVASVLHPDVGLEGAGVIVVFVLVVVGLVALGSLSLTVNAVTTSPQVAAFLGLTHFTAGLDRARLPADVPSASPAPASPALPALEASEPDVPASPTAPVLGWSPRVQRVRRARWVTIPMALMIVLEVVIAGAGVAGAWATPSSSDPMARLLQRMGWEGDVTLAGPAQIVTDTRGDQASGTWPEADLKLGEYAVAPNVPPWVLEDLFPCDTVAFCSVIPDPRAYDNGALLVLLQVAEPPSHLGPGGTGEWGPLLALPGSPSAPAGDPSYAFSTVAYLTRFGPESGELHRLVFQNGAFRDNPSSARSVWVGDTLVTIIPMAEVQTLPSGWDDLASVEGAREIAPTRDWLRSGGGPMLPFSNPPTLRFNPEAGASP
jgi:hypothetical protein